MNGNYTNLKIEEKVDSLSKKISVEIENNNINHFQLKMILNGCASMIKPNVIYEDEKTVLEYDVSNFTSFEKFFHFKKTVTEIIDLTLDLIDVINHANNFYLDHSLFLIEKKLMYYNNITSEPMLIYLPILNFVDSDILVSIKSELFRDANNMYSEECYSKLLFSVISSSTLMGLKYSLIELESNLYDGNELKSNVSVTDIKNDDLAGKMIENKDLAVASQYDKSQAERATATIQKKEGAIKKVNILKFLVAFTITTLVIAVFILIALLLQLPMIPTIIIGAVSALLISSLIIKKIKKESNDDLEGKKTKRKKIKNSKQKTKKEDFARSEVKKAENTLLEELGDSKTVLISDLKNIHRLIDIESGEVYSLAFDYDNVLTLGRASSSDICISEKSIGRNHLNLLFNSGEIYMCDNNSLNGSFINEIKLNPLKNYLINNGDIIGIGKLKLRFQIA